MGTVVKEKDGRFRVRIRRKVRGVLIDKSARFERLTDARKWDQQIEAEITAGKFFKTLEAEQHTLNDVLLRYKQHLVLENPRRLKTVTEAAKQLLAFGMTMGACTIFKQGEPVFTVKPGILTVQVRRKGDPTPYWTAIEAIR